MKNKGFTLIELLGVIVILSILAVITIPIIDSSLNKGKENMSKTQKQQLIKGLKDYYADNLSDFNRISTEECKTVRALKKAGYLPANIEDPKTGSTINEETTKVCVTKDGNKYEYSVNKG